MQLTRRRALEGLLGTAALLGMPSIIRANPASDISIGYYVPEEDQLTSASRLSWIVPANMMGMCLEPLVRIGGENTLDYVLAESITGDDTGKIWDIQLRPQAVWRKRQTPLTAAQVVANFNAWIGDPESSLGHQLAVQVEDILAISANHVQVRLKQSNYQFLYLLTSYAALIMHPDDGWSFMGSDGTGPYDLQSYHKKSEAVFLPAAQHWNPKEAARWPITYLHDTGALDQRYDFMPSLDPDQSIDLVKVGMAMKENALADAFVFHMDCRTAPLNDPVIRQVLKLCVDAAKMVQSIDGFGRPADHTHSNTIHIDYPEPFSSGISFNPTLAKNLLAGRQLTIPLHYLADNLWQEKLSKELARQAAGVGITLELKPIPRAEFDENWDKYPGLTAIKWVHRPLAMQLFDEVYRSTASWNLSGWKNENFDSLVTAAFATPLTQKTELSGYMRQAMQIMQTDGPMIQPVWLNCNKAYKPSTLVAESVEVGSGGHIYANRLQKVG